MLNHDKHLPERVRYFVKRCREAGVRITHQRTEVFRELARTQEHPDAETIYKRIKRRIPTISLDTVYRNLRTLEQHRVIQKVGATGYRSRFDANMQPHHHFVCRTCGSIRDLKSERLDRPAASHDGRAIGVVDSIYVELRGICRACERKQEKP